MSEPLSQDKDLQAYFTNVEDLQNAFKAALATEKLDRRLLVIHGVGGVGKSSLLRMFRLHCKKAVAPVGLASGDEAKSAVDVLALWVEDLKADGARLRGFSETYRQYRVVQAKVEEQARKAGDMRGKAIDSVGKAASKAAVEAAASLIPVVGPVASALGGVGAEALFDWLRGFLSKPEIDLYLDPTGRLTEDFLAGVAKAAAKQRLVLMLDTFEQMTVLDEWVRELARTLHPNVLLVIAGRGMPNWGRAWPEWLAYAKAQELAPMTEDNMRDLVRRYYAFIRGGDPDPIQVEAIVKFARGLPMVVNSAVRLWVEYGVEDFLAVKSEVVADLVDRLNEGMPNELCPILDVAAILRWFNKDLLRAMTKQEKVDSLYAEMRRFPFVRSRLEGMALHDAVREILNENMLIHEPAKYKELHQLAFRYFQDQLPGKMGRERDEAIIEMVYHQLETSESEGIALIENLFDQADQQWALELKGKILKEAQNHELKEASHKQRLQLLQGFISVSWREQERIYKHLLDERLDNSLRVRVLRALTSPLAYQGKPKEERRQYLLEALDVCALDGDQISQGWILLDLCWQTDDLDESLDFIQQAIQVFGEHDDQRGMAEALAQIGWNHLNRWQADEARNAFLQSMHLSEKLGYLRDVAFIQERIGQTYLIEGDFSKAIAFKEKALEIFEKSSDLWNAAWTLDELATCYQTIGCFEATLDAARRALSIFKTWDDHRAVACRMRQGGIYKKQGRLDIAMETYQELLQGATLHSDWTAYDIYSGIGHVWLAYDDPDKARESFLKGIKVFRDHNKQVDADLAGNLDLGDLYLAQRNLLEAARYYNLCLATARAVNSRSFECLGLMGLLNVSYRLGDIEQVEKLAKEIEELGQIHQYDRHLAELYLIQGHVVWDSKSSKWENRYGSALRFYQRSLIFAMHYNRFRLDCVLSGAEESRYRMPEPIISRCLERGEEGRQMLIALRDWWQTGINDTYTVGPDDIPRIPQNIPLLDAERIARQREPGDGAPQTTVVEMLEQALQL